MGRNKKVNKKKGAPKLAPAVQSDLTILVDKLIKKCAKTSSSTSSKEECQEFEEIYNIVEQIRKIEKDITLPEYDREQQMKELLIWAEKKDIKVSKLSPNQYGDEGFGMTCRELIHDGEVALEVPLAAMLTEQQAVNTYLGTLISRDHLLQEMGNVRLALHVLVELLNPESEWRAYVRSLPRDQVSPLYFSPSQIRTLRNSSLLESAVKHYRNIGRQYAYFYRLLRSLPEARDWPLKEYFTYDAYRWSVCTVSSRVNSIPAAGAAAPPLLALVPLWDIINHRPGKMSTDFLVEEGKLVCYACRDFRAGEQFCMHYGHRANAELFMLSGFVVPDNPYDYAVLRCPLPATDADGATKVSLLRLLGVEDGQALRLLVGEKPVTGPIWATAVLYCAQHEFVQELSDAKNPAELLLQVQDDPRHVELREAAVKFLSLKFDLQERLLTRDLTSIAQDSTDGKDVLLQAALQVEISIFSAARRSLNSPTFVAS
ncbi:SET domain [Trinorchestia longiramus]|nr:SET domain [Trinorchestia longiramus]